MKALITGAASGIGRATCLRIASDGKRADIGVELGLIDIAHSDAAQQAMQSLVVELQSLGAKPLVVGADLTKPEDCERAVHSCIEEFGALDALVSNAGINRIGKLIDYTVEDWDAVFAVNTRATWLLAKAAHNALAESGGAIVATSSMSGNFAHAGLGAYGPSKAAVSMLVRVLAQEFGRDGIRANAVSPGMTHTGMTRDVYADNAVAQARAELVPLGRVAQPEDIADVIVFLLGPDARYINGQDIIVDGGMTGNYLGRIPGLDRITRS